MFKNACVTTHLNYALRQLNQHHLCVDNCCEHNNATTGPTRRGRFFSITEQLLLSGVCYVGTFISVLKLIISLVIITIKRLKAITDDKIFSDKIKLSRSRDSAVGMIRSSIPGGG
jgi:hypothetical protein